MHYSFRHTVTHTYTRRALWSLKIFHSTYLLSIYAFNQKTNKSYWTVIAHSIICVLRVTTSILIDTKIRLVQLTDTAQFKLFLFFGYICIILEPYYYIMLHSLWIMYNDRKKKQISFSSKKKSMFVSCTTIMMLCYLQTNSNKRLANPWVESGRSVRTVIIA